MTTKTDEKPADAVDEPQPETFPVDFEMWASQQPAYSHVLVAGFRMAVKKRGDLMRKQQMTAWSDAFTKFNGARTGEE